MPEGEERERWGAAALEPKEEEQQEQKQKTLWDLFMDYLKEKEQVEGKRLVDTVH